jgi:hypothetical protein
MKGFHTVLQDGWITGQFLGTLTIDAQAFDKRFCASGEMICIPSLSSNLTIGSGHPYKNRNQSRLNFLAIISD